MAEQNRLPRVDAGFLGLRITRRLAREPLVALNDLARASPGVCSFRMGPYPTYLVHDPDVIRAVLVTEAKSFRKFRRQTKLLATIDGDGLVVSEGAKWQRQRRLVQPIFRKDRLSTYAQPILDCTHREIDQWPDSGPLDAVAAMTRITLAISLKLLFGAEASTTEADRVAEAVRVLSESYMDEAGAFVIWPDWLPFPSKRQKRRAIAVLDELIWRTIAERRAAADPGDDFLSRLLAATDDASFDGDGGGMTNQQLRDEAITMFNAGHDTTAAGLAWVCYVIAKHPEWEAKLRDEANAALADGAPADAVARLPLTEAVVKEALRLYPPAWVLFMRHALTNVEIGPVRIRRNGLVMIAPWTLHRDPRHFEEPETFDPGRFLGERATRIEPYTYLPFGEGGHKCIGMDLAILEMTLVTAAMVQRGSLTLERANAEPEPVFALRPRDGLPATWHAASSTRTTRADRQA